MRVLAILTLLSVAPALGGCGALVAGAAGGAVAGAVIKHSNEPGPDYIPPRPAR
jgi:hypothetical protein